MSVGTVTIRTATVKAAASYICNGCGRHGIGETMRLELTDMSHSSRAMAAVVEEQFSTKTGTAFPVGWAHYAGGVHKCDHCIKEGR